MDGAGDKRGRRRADEGVASNVGNRDAQLGRIQRARLGQCNPDECLIVALVFVEVADGRGREIHGATRARSEED